MAFDQNFVPKDLRPINVARINAEEAPISSPARTTDGFYPNISRNDISPPSVSVYLVPATSDGKIVGLSSGSPAPVIVQAPTVPMRDVCKPMPVGTPVVSPSPSNISPLGCIQSPSFGVRTSSPADQATDDGGEDSVSGKKVKFLCSFGGKILPRPSDGMLRYVGGQTRIITVRRDVSFPELIQKMVDACGQPVAMKYQLPDEDLDALVSVSCSDDLENMMEEYEKLLERSPDGLVKLRVFLFSTSELDSSGLMQFGDLQDTSQKYVDAVNGVMEVVRGGIARKESIASATSTQNSDLSATDAIDNSLLGQDIMGPPSTNILSPRSDSNATTDVALRSGCIDANLANPFEATGAPLVTSLASGPSQIMPSQSETLLERTKHPPVQQPALGYDLKQTTMKVTSTPTPYLHGLMDAPQDTISNTEYQNLSPHLIYTTPTPVVTTPRLLLQPQYHDNVTNVVPQRLIPAVHMNMAPPSPSSNISINPNKFATLMQSQRVFTIPDQGYNAYKPQVPGGVAGYCWSQVLSTQEHVPLSMPYQQVTLPENIQRKDDCTMCLKQLPHAHSDTAVQEQSSVTIPDANALYHSLCLDDTARLHPANKVVSSSQAEVVGVSKNLEAQREGQRIVADQPRILGPQCVMGLAGGVQTAYSLATSNAVQSRLDDAAQTLVSPLSRGRLEFLANKPAKCENIVAGASLIAKESLAHDAAKDYPEIFCGTEKSKSPTNHQPRQDDIFDQQLQQVACKDQLVNNAYSTPAVIPEANEAPAMVSPNDLETVFVNKTVQSSVAASNLSGNTQESVNTLYSNEDPWNFLQDSHLPPPIPSKIVTRKEASAPRDPFLDNSSSKDEESIQVQVLDTVVHTNANDNSEQLLSNKASPDFIKQELEATTEEVMTSVFPPSLTDADISASDASHERELQNNIDVVIQARLEGMNVKPEKANLAFPRSDGLGRLQIIKNSDLEELRELGSGTFGTVYHGKWRGTDVAIKRINNRCFAGKPSEQERMIDDFWNEAIKLAGLHHPNVVAFYGVVLDGPGGSVATVTEYMVNGSLRIALQKNERTLDKRKRLLIAMDVAFGMEYLHSRNIVHFDLKSDNLLVNLRDPHRPICKVGDLGLSKVKCQTLISGGVRGTLPWMAPELLNGSSSLVSEKVDVFSFGIVMWELLAGEEPYGDLHYGAIIGGIVSNTLRPAVPDNCDPDWRLLMERCWSPEPPERPSFTEITDELRSMAAKIPSKGQTTASPRTNAHAV